MFGLDISDASIEALELKKRFGRVKLVGYARTEIPEGIVRDGIVVKKKELGEAIKKLLKEAKPRPIREREVILSLPESRIFTHIFKFPAKLKLKQIAEILKFEVPNALPISPEEVYSDFLVLDKTDSEQEIFYVAVPKKVVDDLCEVTKKAGLNHRIFDMESASFARALGREAEEGSVIVDIGARTTIISIFDKNGIRFTTNLGVAGNLFTETIAKKLKIKWQEAEKLKKSCGLLPKDGRCRTGQVFLIVQSTLQPILQEIRTAIKFYEGKSGRKIKKIILCGGSSMMPNIANYFEENLGLKTVVGKPETAEKLSIPKATISPLLLNVFGLALRGAKKKPELKGVNLMFELEKAARFKESRFPKKKIFVYFAVFVLLLSFCGFGYYFYLNPEKLPWYGERYLPKVVPLEFNLEVSTLDEPGVFAGRILEIEKEVAKIFPATGKRIIEGQAQGKVKIFNNSPYGQTLVATTRLLSEDGVLFRLKDNVFIPAGKTAETEVYAEEFGAAGDVFPGKFTIPGLSSFLQKLIYAESEAPMTGGATEVKIISTEDVDKAKTKLEEEILEVAKAESLDLLEAGEVLIPVVLGKEILEIKSDPEQDKMADEFKLQIKIKIKFLAVLESDLKKEMQAQLARRGVKKVKDYRFESVEYYLLNFDETSGEAIVKINTKAIK